MKRNLLSLAAAFAAALMINLSANAQNSRNDVGMVTSKSFHRASRVTTSAATSEINSKAVRDFYRRFSEISGESWFSVDNGFVVKFTKDGIQNRADYDKKGNLLTVFRYLNEDQLPHDVRHLVKSTYYDYGITHIVEVSLNNTTAYLINIQDKTTFKQLKVVNDEMEVTHDYVLAK